MIRFTTPVLIVRVHADITYDTQIYVSFRQKELCMNKFVDPENFTYEDGWTVLRVEFSQKESSKFREDVPVQIQVNWIYTDGTRDATGIKELATIDNLFNREIHYAE